LLFIKNYFLIFILIYFISLITKFIFAYYLNDNFTELSNNSIIYAILWGYKFDLALAAIIAFFTTLVDFHKKSLILLSSLILPIIFLSQISDIFYFYEASRHMGYEIADALTDAFGLTMTALSQHTTLSIIALIISILLFLALKKLFSTQFSQIEVTRYYILKKFLLLLVTVFFARGMMQSIPLNPWQSNQIGDTKLASIALNGTYNGIYALLNKGKKLKAVQLPSVSSEQIKEAFNELYSDEKKETLPLLNKPNIVFLFSESWSAVNMKSYGFNKSTTPFFDEILKKSIRPKAMIAGGHRTTEGIFASISSFQNPLGRTIAKTQLQDYHYPSIINILMKKDNYSSAFFQGSSKETSGTGSLAQTLGFQDSYGKRDVKKRIYEENYWGVHDPDLFNFTFKKVKQLKKPFVIGINGATTHDDKIPKSIKKKHFVEDEKLNNQLNALHFSDFALKDFVNKIEKQYPNTLFVLMADHCGGVKGSSFQNYLIPFALYHKDLKPQYIDTIISQRDIYPTLIDLLYNDTKELTKNTSGKSLLSANNFFADYYHNGTLGWIENDKILEINIATKQKKCYKIVNFKDIKINCTKEILSYENKSLSFTNVSQKLLFEGNVDTFKEYKNAK
jgi:phosphoglycerol transferase MdoB-like AlkP superfamily enzyme